MSLSELAENLYHSPIINLQSYIFIIGVLPICQYKNSFLQIFSSSQPFIPSTHKLTSL
jgi:hypothetical protein